ncbi:hypothetical protein [Methylobacter psychrophilus]|uniref:hypothetical protein n=1 Tax=Methylobacter psychrophilus TaxID=96941 RepID=UPI0021D4E565|nr:hypothetical protein [Methylobacter psychrophilus]
MINNHKLGINNTNEISAAAAIKEKARTSIIKYVFLVYWLLIFEGALRKWVFPEYQQIIFFLRDPIVLLIYVIALRHRIVTRDGLLTAGLLISFVFMALVFLQIVTVKMNVLTLIYGWRMYFFYLPLVFVIKDTFHQADIFKLFRQTLYISIPISALVYFQFISPRDSYINDAYGTGNAFVVTGTRVRTTGTFTFVIGQFMFTGSILTMMIFCWLHKARYALLSLPWLLLCTGTTLAILLLSGSRTAFFMTGLIVTCTFFGMMMTRDTKLKFTGTLLIVFLLLIATVMFLGPLRDSFDAITTRFDEAKSSEGSVIMRALGPILGFGQHITTSPVIGYGIGFGTGGGSSLATGKAQMVLAEDEWSRIIQEVGPGFGLVYIFYRAIFTFLLFKQAIKSARNDNNILPMMLLGFIGFYIFIGQVTTQGTMQGYCWIFVGLVMAASKPPQRTELIPQKPEIPYPNIVHNNQRLANLKITQATED